MSENIYYVDKTKLKTTGNGVGFSQKLNVGTGVSSVYSEIEVTLTGTNHLPPPPPTPRQRMCFDSTLPVEHSSRVRIMYKLKNRIAGIFWFLLVLCLHKYYANISGKRSGHCWVHLDSFATRNKSFYSDMNKIFKVNAKYFILSMGVIWKKLTSGELN
jgi:hypothetical protein